MRRKIQALLYVLAIAGAGGASYYVAECVTDEMEAQTGAAVRGALSRAEIDWAWVEIDGLQAILRGPAPDEAARFRALAAAGEVLNPLNLRDRITVSVPTRRPGTDFRVEIMRNGDSILIHGLAPQDGGPNMSRLIAAAPQIEFVDLIARVADPVPDGWNAVSAVAVEAVEALRTVHVIITPDSLRLEGISPDREIAARLENRLIELASDNIRTETELRLPRPVLSPFVTRFTMDDAGTRFDSCAAESRAGRDVILQAAMAAGADETTECQTALGAPDPNWSTAVAEAIALVSAFGSGTVTFSDLTVTLSLPGDALVSPQFAALLERFENTLPEIYSLTMLESVSSAATGNEADAELRFTATRSPEGFVNLRGPVGALDARKLVETLATARFGQDRLHTALRGRTGLPADWPVHVMAAIDALAMLERGAVTLTPALISVRGETGDPDTETKLSRALTEATGAGLAYAIDITYREELDPVVVAQGPGPQECVDQINAVLEEHEVSFPPGSVEIDTEGFDTIGAIAEIMFDCPEIPMEIGGHTDSQGREEMNQLLSQARADAVLNALVGRRVLVGALSSVGYGEANPIANNDTAEGREANRRIRFKLRDGTETQASDATATQTDEGDGDDG